MQHLGVRQASLLSIKVFWQVNDGLHDLLLGRGSHQGGTFVLECMLKMLCPHFWTSHGLQHQMDGMHQIVLTINHTRSELVIFDRHQSDSKLTWRVHIIYLPEFASLIHLGLGFHESEM